MLPIRAVSYTHLDVYKRQSTGLGLSIAKALIEKMDGNISADYSNNVLSIIIRSEEHTSNSSHEFVSRMPSSA